MDKIAENLLSTRKVTDIHGNIYPLHSETPRGQCEALQALIREIRPVTSLEVGLAYGISTLFICEALKEVKAKKHIILDPFQERVWKNIGIKNISDAGYSDMVEFRSEPSAEFLPLLLRNKVKIDFAYFDANKTFDEIIVNAYYLMRLLNIGGVTVFDDCNFPGIRKACRYLSRLQSLSGFVISGKSRINHKKLMISKIVRHFPKGKWIFAKDLIETDEKMGINARCIGFRKIKEDDRHWAWFVDF
ncbi:MAG: O-methyltransferase [Candidatus Omnitrophota bacterium]